VNLVTNLLRPIQAFRLIYLPLVMVYFAYGALGIIDVTRDMWIKESLSLSPAELSEISVWLGLPWTVKMVFGELVDSVTRDTTSVDIASATTSWMTVPTTIRSDPKMYSLWALVKPIRNLVRVNGVANELGISRRPASDKVFESVTYGRARRVRRTRDAADYSYVAESAISAHCDCLMRTSCLAGEKLLTSSQIGDGGYRYVQPMSALPPEADIETGPVISFDALTPPASPPWPRCDGPHLS
jgi:hypothetical protein